MELSEHAIIVSYNAPYHTRKSHKVPESGNRKAAEMDSIIDNGIPGRDCNESCFTAARGRNH